MTGQNEQLINRIYWLRGQKVMINKDVAALFQVSLKVLRQRLVRNKLRFPQDFLFVPTADEWQLLKQQLDPPLIGKDEIPMVFMEAGLLMASGIIKSEVAVQVSINIINQFFQIVKSSNRR